MTRRTPSLRSGARTPMQRVAERKFNRTILALAKELRRTVRKPKGARS